MRRFGIHANPDLCEDRGGRHAALFVSIAVVAVLGVAKPQQSAKAQGRFQSAVKYSDKPRLARFRGFSTKFFGKRGLDVAMESLVGSIVLNQDLQRRAKLERDEAERRGWEQEHLRPTGAEREGAERSEEANGSTTPPKDMTSRAQAQKQPKAGPKTGTATGREASLQSED